VGDIFRMSHAQLDVRIRAMREAFAVCGPSARDAVVAALDALGPTVGDFFMTVVAFVMFRRLRGEVFDVPRLAETPAITALFQAETAARGIAGAMLHYDVVLDAELQVLRAGAISIATHLSDIEQVLQSVATLVPRACQARNTVVVAGMVFRGF
jgi:hypothetical protein